MATGYVYVLINEHMGGLVKIGFTTRDTKERVRELSSATGVPGRFELVEFYESSDVTRDEKEIHRILNKYRIPRSEFFKLPQNIACDIIKQVVVKNTPVVLKNLTSHKYEQASETVTVPRSDAWSLVWAVPDAHPDPYPVNPDDFTDRSEYIKCDHCNTRAYLYPTGRYWCSSCKQFLTHFASEGKYTDSALQPQRCQKQLPSATIENRITCHKCNNQSIKQTDGRYWCFYCKRYLEDRQLGNTSDVSDSLPTSDSPTKSKVFQPNLTLVHHDVKPQRSTDERVDGKQTLRDRVVAFIKDTKKLENVCQMYLRWQNEKKHADFNDYLIEFIKMFGEGNIVGKGCPFEFRIQEDNENGVFRIFVTQEGTQVKIQAEKMD